MRENEHCKKWTTNYNKIQVLETAECGIILFAIFNGYGTIF